MSSYTLKHPVVSHEHRHVFRHFKSGYRTVRALYRAALYLDDTGEDISLDGLCVLHAELNEKLDKFIETYDKVYLRDIDDDDVRKYISKKTSQLLDKCISAINNLTTKIFNMREYGCYDLASFN